MARALKCKGLGGLSVVLNGVHNRTQLRHITVIQSNLRKFTLFLPILCITENIEVFIQCCMVKIYRIYQLN